MGYFERKKEILNLLSQSQNLKVPEISKALKISMATVRRDLGDMDKEGLILRTHGGALLQEDLPLTGFQEKNKVQNQEKKRIAAKAISYIKPGHTIYLDCGSTVYSMVEFLKGIKGIKVITNSLPIVSSLLPFKGIELNIIGGDLDKERRAVHGIQAIRHIHSLFADLAFIGIDGISTNLRLSSHSEIEAGISRAMLENSGKTYLLADSSKFGRRAFLDIGPMSIVQSWISNTPMTEDLLKSIWEMGVEFISSES